MDKGLLAFMLFVALLFFVATVSEAAQRHRATREARKLFKSLNHKGKL